MCTNKKKLAQVVNIHRANLIKLYSLHFESSATQAIKKITTRAVEEAYVAHRSPPPGEVIKSWVIESRAPQWACRATFDLLIELDWLPKTDIEKAIAARFLLLNELRYVLAEIVSDPLSVKIEDVVFHAAVAEEFLH